MFKPIDEGKIDCGWDAGYVRVGACPRSGKSYNYRDGHHEDGVSVYRAWFQSGGLRAIDLRDVDMASAMFIWADKDAKGVYQVWGDEIGRGSDSEPLLKKKKSRKVPKSGIAPVIRALM